MSTIEVSLPDSVKDFVDSEAARAGFETPGEYVLELIRQAQKVKAQERLESLLLEGLESDARELTSADWDAVRREGEELLAKRKRA
jgi:antitoxin ParD1/3/4